MFSTLSAYRTLTAVVLLLTSSLAVLAPLATVPPTRKPSTCDAHFASRTSTVKGVPSLLSTTSRPSDAVAEVVPEIRAVLCRLVPATDRLTVKIPWSASRSKATRR